MARHGMPGQPLGPFETEAEARAAADAAAEPGPLPVKSSQNRKLLGRVLGAVGVETGRYDDRVVEWLGIWESATVAVITGWVGRAYEAGMARRPGTVIPPAAGAEASVIDVLRAAADTLAVDLATWEARDPAAPSAEARQARRAAIAAADAVATSMARLRARLGGDRP